MGRVSWIIQVLPKSSQWSQWVEEGGKKEAPSGNMGMTQAAIAGFEDPGRGHCQGMKQFLEAWKTKNTDAPQGPRRKQSCQRLDPRSGRPSFDFHPLELWDDTFMLF